MSCGESFPRVFHHQIHQHFIRDSLISFLTYHCKNISWWICIEIIFVFLPCLKSTFVLICEWCTLKVCHHIKILILDWNFFYVNVIFLMWDSSLFWWIMRKFLWDDDCFSLPWSQEKNEASGWSEKCDSLKTKNWVHHDLERERNSYNSGLGWKIAILIQWTIVIVF